jgi:hypothetical protein
MTDLKLGINDQGTTFMERFRYTSAQRSAICIIQNKKFGREDLDVRRTQNSLSPSINRIWKHNMHITQKWCDNCYGFIH